MSKDLSVPPAFGWLTKDVNADAYFKAKNAKTAKNAPTWSNVAKVVGYAPGLGLGIGVGRILSVIQNRKDKEGKLNQVVRAIGEIFGMGPLLFLADATKHYLRTRTDIKAKKAD